VCQGEGATLSTLSATHSPFEAPAPVHLDDGLRNVASRRRESGHLLAFHGEVM
jgi:hypothetical protein